MDEAVQGIGSTVAAAQQRAPDKRHPYSDPPRVDVATGLVQLTSVVQGVYARVAQRHDLTPVQAKLLCVLLDGPRGMAEMAHIFGVEKAALTGLMDRAERRGFAERSAVPGDRRALQAMLTDEGRRTATAFHAEVNAELSLLLAPLPARDREHFHRTMAVILTQCQTGPCGDTSPLRSRA